VDVARINNQDRLSHRPAQVRYVIATMTVLKNKGISMLMDDEVWAKTATAQAAGMTREELERGYVEISLKYYQLSMNQAEDKGPAIEQMQRLLHDARKDYAQYLLFWDVWDDPTFPRRVAFGTRESLQESIDEISRILKKTGWPS
jgi:hypothetical protein